MNIIKRAHDFQKTPFMYLSCLSSNYGEKSSDNLELNLLVSLSCAFANFVNDSIDKSPRECSVTLWTFFFWVKTIIRMVSIHQAVSYKALYVIQNLLGQAGNLSIKS
mgnify:CR=1 FL=1